MLTHDEQYDGSLDPNASPPRYGSQRHYLPLRNNRNQIVEGPRQQKKRPPRKSSRRSRTYISFNSERLSAKRALEVYPKLRRHLLGQRETLKERTLQAKLRRHYKEGEIPHHTTNFRAQEVVQDQTRRIHKNTVAHYTIKNPRILWRR